MERDFVKVFKHSVLILTLAGLYIPKCETLFRFQKAARVYAKNGYYIGAAVIIFYQISQWPNVYWNSEELKTVTSLLMVALPVHFLTLVKATIIKFKAKDLEKLINQWGESFQKPTFYENRRQEEILVQKKLTEKISNIQISMTIVPLTVFVIYPLFSQQQSIQTGLPIDDTKSPAFEIFFVLNAAISFYFPIMWIASDSLFLLLLSTVVAELIHLKYSLAEIFRTIRCNDQGTLIIRGKREIKEEENNTLLIQEMNEMKKSLNFWAERHINLVSYSTKVQRYLSSLTLLEYSYMTFFGVIFIFTLFTGTLEIRHVPAVVGFLFQSYLMVFAKCWFGDQISYHSEHLTDGVLSDWTIYPKDVKKILHTIMINTVDNPVKMHAFSTLFLDLRSFEKLTKMAYSITMFMANVRNKTS